MNVNESKPMLDSMKDQTQEINLTEFLFHFLDHWKFIIISMIITSIVVTVPTYLWAERKYTTSSMIYILNPSDSVLNLSDLQMGNYLANDYLKIFETHELNQMVADHLDLPYSYGQIRSMTKISNIEDTRILRIQATSNDPTEAALIANKMAECASDYISEIMVTDHPTILSSAMVPSAPSQPNITSTAILSAAVGLLVSCAYLAISFLMDDKLKNSEAFTKVTGLPIYAEIPVIDTQRVSNDRYSSTRDSHSSGHKREHHHTEKQNR